MQATRSLCQQVEAAVPQLVEADGLAALAALLSVGDLDSRLEQLAAEALAPVLALSVAGVATAAQETGMATALVHPQLEISPSQPHPSNVTLTTQRWTHLPWPVCVHGQLPCL